MTGIKNINKAEVMALKDQVEYQDGCFFSHTGVHEKLFSIWKRNGTS